MTKMQELQIRLLRSEGKGYRYIASQVGLSRDIVRNFCKQRGLYGYGCAVEENVAEQGKLRAFCFCCGKAISQAKTGRPRKYCSEVCRRHWWNLHPNEGKKRSTAEYKRVCIRCGKEYISYGNRKRKYCSHYCYVKDRFGESK